MEKIYINIKKGQHLSEIYQIESNTILCKTLTGLGATYSEIKADRDSIIIEPNQPAIIGKCKSEVHKKDNLFKVMEKVTVSDIVEYLENTIDKKKRIKILTTPESFYKVKQAFEEIEEPMYLRCFLLMDECQKYIQDNDYREAITIPIDDFFEFEEKAMVSATPIIPSDPRFEEQNFRLVEVIPEYEYKIVIGIQHTNNVLESLKRILPEIIKNQEQPRPICLFVNSTDMIHQLMEKLNIMEESSVFCSTKSVDKLKRRGFKKAYEHWDKSKMERYNFFTSRFFTALDIELEEKPDVIFVTEPYFFEYTAIDPSTDMVQSIGRFRNGIGNCLHIVNTHGGFAIRTKEGLKEYLNASKTAYNTVKKFYETATTIETRNAFKNAMEVLPYNKVLRKGKTDYFAIDNYMDEQMVKSSYNNIDLLMERYKDTPTLNPHFLKHQFFPLSDFDRLKFENKSGNTKDKRVRMVEILESLKEDYNSPMVQFYISDLKRYDPFIVEAFETVGKEIIESLNYSRKKIKEAMILKRYREKTSGLEFIELLKNSFEIGKKYTRSYIKKELVRIYKLLGINGKKAITAETIKEFFNVQEVYIKRNKGFLIKELNI